MRRQFTATVYILHEFKVLLIFHRKLFKWLPPGGHVDENELPSDTAIREAREETGLEIELVSQEKCLDQLLECTQLSPPPPLFTRGNSCSSE